LFVTLWEFEVKSGSEELFEAAYGPEGAWVGLFRRNVGYLSTRLLRDVAAPRTYLTADCWESREAYEQFEKTHGAEYSSLDRECEGLTVYEKHLAEFPC